MGVERVAIIGIDCATPQLLFERFAEEMPVLSGLRERALWGPMRSVVPPITVPAWSCMMSGRTPGELGVYGFRNRPDRSYQRQVLASSSWIGVPRLWDLVGAAGEDSVVLGVPGTYPPAPVRGAMVSCLLTPSTQARYTHPPELAAEVERVTGGYVLDVADFREGEEASVAQRIFDMTEQRFALARHLATTRPWKLFAMVDMGADRLHHRFWRYCDPSHPGYQPGNRFQELFADYYRALDRHLGSLLEALPDGTAVLVVSDHGAQPMVGGFRFNQWLVEQEVLALKNPPPDEPASFDATAVDWPRTVAWGHGGYYGRLFLNVAGREPEGVVPAARYEQVVDDLAAKLEALPDHQGRPMGTRVARPREVYPQVRGVAPDLIVYFGDLRWRAIGSVGGTGTHVSGNDTGIDHANHAEHGVLVLTGSALPTGHRDDLSLYDVAPTVQALLGLPAPPGQRGRVLV